MKTTPPKTIQDIAIKTGVSISTVSRALRNDRRISAETKRRIVAVAEEIGYVPNPLISALMTHLRTTKPVQFQSMIAYVDTSSNPSETNTWISSKLHRESVRSHAARLGYTIDCFWFHDPAVSPAKLVKILCNRGIQAVILHYLPTRRDILHTLSLDLSSFAVASLGAKLDDPFIHYACTDHFVIVQQALAELEKLGYQRIGLAMDTYVNNVVENRFLGAYLGWQSTLAKNQQVAYYLEADLSKSAFAEWIKREQPDCILCINREICDWLEEMGIVIPQQMGVAHLDLVENDRNISGIQQNHEAAASAAVDLITGQLNRNERGIPSSPKAVLMGGTWVPGSTVRMKTYDKP